MACWVGLWGVAVGAVAGTLTGSLFDLARLGVSDDFLTEVSSNLVPRESASWLPSRERIGGTALPVYGCVLELRRSQPCHYSPKRGVYNFPHIGYGPTSETVSGRKQ